MHTRLGRTRIVAITGIIAVAAVIAACQPASLSGNGKAASVISGGKQMQFEFKSNVDCTNASTTTGATVAGIKPGGSECMSGGAVALLKGGFKDEGKNPAFPWGVSMSFSGGADGEKIGLAIGLGIDGCSGTPGSVGAQHDETGDPTCYLGLVTYRSTDTKHYPNATPLFANPDCMDSLSGFPFSTQQGIRALDAGSGKDQLSGLALVVIGDSGTRGSKGSNDMLFLGAVCGPYANLDLSGPTRATPIGYAYGTCPVGTEGSPFGGMIPDITDLQVKGTPLPFGEECFRALTGGNLGVRLSGTWDSTTTTSTTLL